jgi:hypothetical protein
MLHFYTTPLILRGRRHTVPPRLTHSLSGHSVQLRRNASKSLPRKPYRMTIALRETRVMAATDGFSNFPGWQMRAHGNLRCWTANAARIISATGPCAGNIVAHRRVAFEHRFVAPFAVGMIRCLPNSVTVSSIMPSSANTGSSSTSVGREFPGTV